jgi:hypothetical protein
MTRFYFDVRDDSSRMNVHHESGYDFSVSKKAREASFTCKRPGQDLTITCRDMWEYVRALGNIPIRRNLKYVEIGTGVGALVPDIVKTGVKSRPTVIDPADYGLMLAMLFEARDRLAGSRQVRYINELVERVEIILDPSKVVLVNQKLGEAYQSRPDLAESADVVIDNLGPCFYPSTEILGASNLGDSWNRDKAVENIISLEAKFLRKGGILITSDVP